MRNQHFAESLDTFGVTCKFCQSPYFFMKCGMIRNRRFFVIDIGYRDYLPKNLVILKKRLSISKKKAYQFLLQLFAVKNNCLCESRRDL